MKDYLIYFGWKAISLADLLVVIGGIWALFTFHRSLKNKAADTLIQLQKDYCSHLPLLLEIEDSKTYPIIERAILISMIDLCVKEEDLKQVHRNFIKKHKNSSKGKIEQLEAALQYIYICQRVQSLSVDSGSLSRMCGYHLRLVHRIPEKDETLVNRDVLKRYMEVYWPSIYCWSQMSHRPFIVRIFKYPHIYWKLLVSWWTGNWAHPNREARTKFIDESLKIVADYK